MKKFTGRFVALFALAGLFVFSGCGDDDEGPTQTIWEIVESREDLSALEAELQAAGLADMLDDPSASMTLFAPNNTALTSLLNLLGADDFSNVSSTVVDDVLTYHVADQRLTQAEITGTVTTSQGEDITVVDGSLESGASSPADIVLTIEATNGIIHIVDAVLLPPSLGIIADAIGTSAQVVFLAEDYTTLAAAIQKADATKTDPAQTITGALIGAETTVFGVPNQVFEAADITVATYSGAEWDAIIRKHIVPEKLESLPTAATKPNLAGGNLVIDGASTPPTVNQVPILVDGAVVLQTGAVYPIGGIIQ